jgi:signal transduction histidine kinase
MFTISQKWLARILAVSVLALWFAFIFAGNSIGVFQPRPNELPINLLLASLTPVAIFAVSYIGWAGFRRFVLSLDLRLITIFQGADLRQSLAQAGVCDLEYTGNLRLCGCSHFGHPGFPRPSRDTGWRNNHRTVALPSPEPDTHFSGASVYYPAPDWLDSGCQKDRGQVPRTS